MDSSAPLHAVLTDSIIRRLAGEASYQRGLDYFHRKLVHSLHHSGEVVEAIVSGTEDYAVRLSAQRKRLAYTCKCHIGAGGTFCKHCVATALAWLAATGAATPAQPVPKTKPAAQRKVTDADIRKALASESREALVERLIDWSHQDKALRQRITTLSTILRDPLASVQQVRAQLQKAIHIKNYVDYRGVEAYAGRVRAALDAVELVLRQGHATPVVAGAMAAGVTTLCEDAMRWLEESINNVDDSDGQGTELMGRIAELHLQSCDLVKPDPEALGARLFSLESNAGYGQWDDATERYSHLLGKSGLAAYLAAARKVWDQVPPRTVKEGSNYSNAHHGVTHIMESLARESGDVEQIVAVLERDLTSAYRYANIAGEYRNAGLFEKALSWAERGLALDPNNASLQLFVAEEYQRAERHSEALHIVWAAFRGQTSLQSYQLLERFARAADDWDDAEAWRARALAHIRKQVAEKIAKARKLPASYGDLLG